MPARPRPAAPPNERFDDPQRCGEFQVALDAEGAVEAFAGEAGFAGDNAEFVNAELVGDEAGVARLQPGVRYSAAATCANRIPSGALRAVAIHRRIDDETLPPRCRVRASDLTRKLSL